MSTDNTLAKIYSKKEFMEEFVNVTGYDKKLSMDRIQEFHIQKHTCTPKDWRLKVSVTNFKTEWEHSRVDGGPDRRYKENPSTLKVTARRIQLWMNNTYFSFVITGSSEKYIKKLANVLYRKGVDVPNLYIK